MKFRVILPVPSLPPSLPFVYLRIWKSGGLSHRNELSLLYL